MGSKLTKVWKPLYTASLWCLNSQCWSHWASSNYSSGFSALALVCKEVSVLVSCDSLYPVCLSSFEGHQSVLCSFFSERSKKSDWFFGLFSLLLVIRMDWWHSTSFCSGLETIRKLGLCWHSFLCTTPVSYRVNFVERITLTATFYIIIHLLWASSLTLYFRIATHW